MDIHKKHSNNYDRVMSRVFNRSRSTLRSSSNVTRHDAPSSVRVGAKPSVSAVSSSVFSELPTVLNDYVPDDKVVRRSVKPRRTLKSLDPGKARSPPRLLGSASRNVRTRSSVPVFRNKEEWSESHVRQCYSSRSHTRLKEIKDEIKAFRETDKLLKLRSHLYKSCGVVLDDAGNVARDVAVQAEPEPDKENKSLRIRKWMTLLGREDLLDKDLKQNSRSVCSAHFDESSIKITKSLHEDAYPSLFLANQPDSSKAQPISTLNVDATVVLSNSTEGVTSYSDSNPPSGSVQIAETQTNNQEPLSEKQIKTSKLLTEELKECKRKQRKLSSKITKMRQQLEAKNKLIKQLRAMIRMKKSHEDSKVDRMSE